MSNYLRVILIVVIIAIAVVALREAKVDMEVIEGEGVTEEIADAEAEALPPATLVSETGDLLYLFSPGEDEMLDSPLVIVGDAPGYWFFEATMTVKLLDGEGNLVAEGYVEATEEWMTEDLVAFTGELEFERPEIEEGVIRLERHNASGLPEHDDSAEMVISFKDL